METIRSSSRCHQPSSPSSWLTRVASSRCMGSTAIERKHGLLEMVSTGSEIYSLRIFHKHASSAGAMTRTHMQLIE
jgi:hypothetical protein